ncbi:molybdopterin-dependent oxidoreductase [Caldichromatium japonicum]|uniref:molybdopterin-dependent oxidoreductase n=1 Tax=Caldichromatium japonicum TaxID=2699430 RepID=UPI0031B636AD
MLDQPLQSLVLWGLEPDLDLIDPQRARQGCERAECVVACSSYDAPVLRDLADILLPIAAFAETSGTFVNANATWQSFAGAVMPPGEARPGWKVLRVLGNLLDLSGFEYQDSAEVREELAALCATATPDNRPRAAHWEPGAWIAEGPALIRVAHVPIYRLDPLVRRARALSQMPGAEWVARLHPEQAAQLGLAEGDWVRIKQGEAEGKAPVLIDAQIPLGVIALPAAVCGSESLGAMIGPVVVARLNRQAES